MSTSTAAKRAAGRIAAILAICVVAVAMTTGAALAKSAKGNLGNKLTCFDGPSEGTIYGGACTISSAGVATLDNTGGNVNGSYSGVYIQGTNLTGKRLANVGQLSFNYTGDATAGSPRISLPLDTDADGTTDVYAFISAYWCNNGAGFVDGINNPDCQIFVPGVISAYTGWAAFVAAYPTATVGSDGAPPFVIADDAGSWTVSNVHLGKASRTGGN